MDTRTNLFVRSLSELDAALESFDRRATCVKCDDKSKLTCPACPSGQTCQYTVPIDCSQCAKAICMDDSIAGGGDDSGGSDNNSSSSSSSGGPNAGAIAGGVIGGVIVIAALTYLVWRYLIRPKRSQMPVSIYGSESQAPRDSEKDAQSRITKRSSTHTVHSIASTVLTRASNIIQIAYIPGVTNRAGPSGSGAYVPPVPPIPMHHTSGSSGHHDDQPDEPHFFMPGDLRNSSYSGYTTYSDRTSYAPRASIASTIYGKQAQVFTGTQTGTRVRPNMVSVKSSPGATPPMPEIDFDKYSSQRPKSGMSTFSVGSTFLNNANTAQQARGAQVVRVGGGLKTVNVGGKANSGSSSTATTVIAPTIVEEGVVETDGPFSDNAIASSAKSINASSLGAVTEESDSRGSQRNLNRPGSKERGSSPFGDEHATRE